MKKTLKTVILAVLILSVGFAGGYFAFKWTSDEKVRVETVDKDETDKEGSDNNKKSENNAYPEGTVFVLCPSTHEDLQISQKERDSIVAIMRLKLDACGFQEATVNTRKEKGKTLFEVWIPEVFGQRQIEKMSGYLRKNAKLSFRDDNGTELINETHISEAQPIVTQEGMFVVQLTFTRQGQKLFADATAANVGRQISIYVDNMLISSPNVNEAINSNTCIIEGGFDEDSARLLAAQLNHGAKPFDIEVVSINTISK